MIETKVNGNNAEIKIRSCENIDIREEMIAMITFTLLAFNDSGKQAGIPKNIVDAETELILKRVIESMEKVVVIKPNTQKDKSDVVEVININDEEINHDGVDS